MRILSAPEELRRACDGARAAGVRVALVPTMGALHEGHVALVREAATRSPFVVVTIFVNPTQFGANEDLAKYPRTLEADCDLVEKAGAALVFAPRSDAAMYPAGDETRVRVGAIVAALCGVSRPTHFEGVTTIVAKLFGLVGPCVACFGRKDYQQLRAITRMATDLFMPVEIVAVPTVREPDGLAMSSRNRYLSPDARARAVAIPRALRAAAAAFEAGERSAARLESVARAVVEPSVDSIDYVSVADPLSVVPTGEGETGERALLAIAVRLGGARLIDNMVLGEERAPVVPGEGA